MSAPCACRESCRGCVHADLISRIQSLVVAQLPEDEPDHTCAWVYRVAVEATVRATIAAGSISEGAVLIAAERRRQVQDKGYDAAHDDRHDDCDLTWVASEIVAYVDPHHTLTPEDPWGIIRTTERKHPDSEKSEIRLLVVAASLLAAEVDRRLRALRLLRGSDAAEAGS